MRTILLTLMLLPGLLSRPALAAQATPVTMTAYLDKPMYQIGQPIVLEVDLNNLRPRKVIVGGGAYEKYSFRFVLLDAAGKTAPLTALGKEVLGPPPEVYVNPPIVFGPKATRRYRINLAALFLLSRANNYTLRVSRILDFASGPASSLTAGPFKFRIMEAASRNAPATPFVEDPNAILNIP